MYLSRVQIDTNNRRKIHDLTHLGAYHSWVEDSFPEEKEHGERTRKLWRIDCLDGKDFLLIVSTSKPDLMLLEKYGVPGSAATKQYDRYLNSIKNGEAYRFRATLNPEHSVSLGQDKRGRVYPEITIEQQMGYFRRKAETNGFKVEDGNYRIVERGYGILRKPGSRAVHLCRATYEGKLIVTNAELFRSAMVNGIGRKKAYGFGMITVIPEV